MAFEVFPRNQATGRTSEHHPEVTVDSRGTLVLSAVAYEAIGSPERVTLMADRIDGVVAICWAPPDGDDEAWPVSSRRISCSRFTEWAGLPRSRRWTATASLDAIRFSVEGPSQPVTSNRAGTGQSC